jgi:replicative DNA helicase
MLTMESDDWYQPKHGDLANVIQKMMRNDAPIDAVTVFGQCSARGLKTWDAPSLFSLVEAGVYSGSAPMLAQRLKALAGRRKLLVGCQRAEQMLYDPQMDDTDGDIRFVANKLRQACDDAEAAASGTEHPLPLGMGEFLRQQHDRDWLIPGLLERMDRTIITGAEGGGKSVLVSQMAACMAGGLHPFTGNVLGGGGEGVRVLVLDCENSAPQSQRRYQMITDRVSKLRQAGGFDPVDWDGQMRIETQPKGIDLLSGRDVGWVEYVLSEVKPDLLCLGPLYKLHRGEPSDEVMARDLAWVLDGLRERYRFSLITEAHAGHAKDGGGNRMMRPIGSSLFLRWPEFGFGLRRSSTDPGKGRARVVDVVPWRGSREERDWPELLEMSERLPWAPSADYFAEISDLARF